MHGIIGPFFFEDKNGKCFTVNGERYKEMLEGFMIPKLKEMKLRNLWFQRDGATCHTAKACMRVLRDKFKERVISRFGEVNWPRLFSMGISKRQSIQE